MPNKLNFYERAARLGHSHESLKAGKMVRSCIPIADIEALKTFVDEGMTPEEMKSLAEDLFGDIPTTDPEKDGSEEGIVRRVEAYLYDAGPLYDVDRERTKHVFPVSIDAVSQETGVVNTPQDLGTGGTMAYVNYGTLTLQNGGYFVLYNKALTFVVDTLIRNGGGAGSFYDINILGATGTAGGTGTQPGIGGGGGGGTPGTCRSPGIQGNDGGPGKTGSTGSTGGTGATGSDGSPSLGATITINTLLTGTALPLQVYSRSGAGGTGGVGGTGAQGGPGGKGGDGQTCGCEGTSGGVGGVGGTGGVGGAGGTGGNGVNASANIVITVPNGQISQVVTFTAPAPTGTGGSGGTGGVGGTGGGGGAGGKHHSGGGTGQPGGGGTPGTNGTKGSISGNPAQIIVRQS